MAWADFYLICLAAGFIFSVLSVFGGALHVPHVHLHWGGLHGGAHVHAGGTSSGARGGASPFNAASIAVFLMWFGAGGFLLTRFAGWRLLFVVAGATVCGAAGGAIVFWFLAKVLVGAERPLDPMDYDLTGAFGRLSSAIRQSGTGELIFSQQGRRCGVPARSETGEALPRGTEVVVTRYESGIAYVRTWSELQ